MPALISRNFYVTAKYHQKNCTFLGFWMYLMSDCLMFTSLFATYAVLGKNYANGPTGLELFDLQLVAINTILLLFSSIMYSFTMSAIQKKINLYKILILLSISGLLGICFLYLEIYELLQLIYLHAGPQRSGFLTSFFTLISTHGLHVIFGIIWLITLMIQIWKYNLIIENVRRLICLSMFWHFLDIIWVGIFTFVYLMGILK